MIDSPDFFEDRLKGILIMRVGRDYAHLLRQLPARLVDMSRRGALTAQTFPRAVEAAVAVAKTYA